MYTASTSIVTHIIWLLLHIEYLRRGCMEQHTSVSVALFSNQQQPWIFDEGVWRCVVPMYVMFMLIVPYNVMCSSVGNVLCIVFLFASPPTEFLAEYKRNVEQETPKKRPAVAVAERPCDSWCSAVYWIVGWPSVKHRPLQTKINLNYI